MLLDSEATTSFGLLGPNRDFVRRITLVRE